MCNWCNKGLLVILRSPTDHPKTARSHIPPKNFVCCIPNAVSQTSVNPKGMKQHNKKKINIEWLNGNTFWTVNHKRALNTYHFSKYKMQILKTHFTVQSSFTTKCVPSFHSKNANNDNDGNNK